MAIMITAFERSPDKGQGHARDMRVRWALEEAGLDYSVRLLSFEAMKQPAYLAMQPFGAIPTYEEGDLVIFESGAILLHIAEHHAGLLPVDACARVRAVSWLFAALNTVEPPIVEREGAILVENQKPWFAERVKLVEDRIRGRLGFLSRTLGDAAWLSPEFTIADLMMVTVLRRLDDCNMLENEYPNLAAYVARGEARPAYKRAFAGQLAVFKATAAN